MRYLVTGGCGFLGSNVAAAVLRSGGELAVLDNLFRTGGERNHGWLRTLGDLRFVHGDVRSWDDCDALMRSFRPEVVFHFAGQVAMTTSLLRPRLDFEINALGTLNILEAIRAHCPEAALVYASSNKVYGDLESLRYGETAARYMLIDFPRGLPESLPLDFHSPYGCSKGSADQYVLDYARIFGLRATVFRHSSMYGERQFATIDQGWIGWFCLQAIRQGRGEGEEFTISGNGKQVRDILHVDDAVALYLESAERIDSLRGQAFNIGGGMDGSLSVLELMHLLEHITKTRLAWRHLEARVSDQRVFVADLAKIQSRLSWRPVTGVRDGIERMVHWLVTSAAGNKA